MGSSATAIIIYGVPFEDTSLLPWYSEEEDEPLEAEEWWLNECNYQPPFQVYNPDGTYVGGKSPEQKILDERLILNKSVD